jgi:TolB-like protein/DNA-binding winged helix-turn-helix (wHTH) protein/Tfp pilus assembly protein PilF
VGEWTVFPELNSLERYQRTVRVEPKVMQVLLILCEHSGQVVSKEQIFHRVWPDTFVSDEVLTRSVSELRKVFEDSPQEPKYIQTIPKGGYRLVAPVLSEPRKGVDTGRWKKLATITAIILLVAAATVYTLRPRERFASKAAITSLAVLPLANLSGDASQDYFADGMTDELTTRLSNISALRVISRTSVLHYKNTQKTIPEIARELNVDAVLEGSVLRSGDKVRISAQLIQARADRHLWAESYERDVRDVLSLQSDVARAVTKEIKIQVTSQEEKKLAAVKTVNPEAYDSYMKGNFYWEKFTEEGMKKAVDYFDDAIQKQPDYAAAYAGLANTYHELAFYVAPREVMPKGKQAATRALELDGTDAEAHAALGWIKWHYDWDWPGADQEYIRALELNPRSTMAHGQYALFLNAMGRFEESLREHELSVATDPLSLGGKTNLGDLYYGSRRYDEAVKQYRQVLELDANFALAQAGLGTAYLQQDKLQEAIVHLQRATQLDTDPLYEAILGYAYAVAGEEPQARRVITQLAERAQKSYVSPAAVALVYLGMGKRSQACDWLERGYQARDSNLAQIRIAPLWDKLRPEPCFKSLLRRMGD